MDVSSVSGYVPLSGASLSITCNSANLNYGTYYDTVVASATGYANIYLPVKLNVVYQKPESWSVNPSAYKYSVNMIANYREGSGGVYGLQSVDTMDQIAVVMGTTVRGVANIKNYGTALNPDYAAYITIYYNASDNGQTSLTGKDISLRVWDATKGKEYERTDTTAVNLINMALESGKNNTMGANKNLGTLQSPFIIYIDTIAGAARYIPIKAGYNWISFNEVPTPYEITSNGTPVTPTLLDLNRLFSSLHSTTNNYVKTMYQIGYYSPDGTGNWVSIGNAGTFGISTDSGYVLYSQNADTLRTFGKPTDSTHKFTTQGKGWIFLGYPPQSADNVNNALSLVAPSSKFSAGDIIMDQTQFARYDTIIKSPLQLSWAGSLEYMEPNHAYLLYTGQQESIAEHKTGVNLYNPSNWTVNPSQYQYNMTFVGDIMINENRLIDVNSMVGAFVNGECRGSGQLTYVPSIKAYLVNMFVYTNNPTDTISFMIFDHINDSVYNDPQTVRFAPDSNMGTFKNPYVFMNQISTGVAPVAKQVEINCNIYPNPFSDGFSVTLSADKPEKYKIEIADILGNNLFTDFYDGNSGGNTFNISVKDKNLSAGLYFVTITDEAGKTTTRKLQKIDKD